MARMFTFDALLAGCADDSSKRCGRLSPGFTPRPLLSMFSHPAMMVGRRTLSGALSPGLIEAGQSGPGRTATNAPRGVLAAAHWQTGPPRDLFPLTEDRKPGPHRELAEPADAGEHSVRPDPEQETRPHMPRRPAAQEASSILRVRVRDLFQIELDPGL